MREREALSALQEALAAIDLILRNGKVDTGRVSALARQARVSAERAARAARPCAVPAALAAASLAAGVSALHRDL